VGNSQDGDGPPIESESDRRLEVYSGEAEIERQAPPPPPPPPERPKPERKLTIFPDGCEDSVKSYFEKVRAKPKAEIELFLKSVRFIARSSGLISNFNIFT